jgi:hypothetical protein
MDSCESAQTQAAQALFGSQDLVRFSCSCLHPVSRYSNQECCIHLNSADITFCQHRTVLLRREQLIYMRSSSRYSAALLSSHCSISQQQASKRTLLCVLQHVGDVAAFAKAACLGIRAAAKDSLNTRTLSSTDFESSTATACNVGFLFICSIFVMFMQYGFAAVCTSLQQRPSIP